jgi:hypothetical protein
MECRVGEKLTHTAIRIEHRRTRTPLNRQRAAANSGCAVASLKEDWLCRLRLVLVRPATT